ncbi:hypothetical protein [Thiocystis violacea]|uniref:hypothetical protein n=1 Tax=Thiocystis violacea TaxID=13725 RepID=UPI0019058D95|nr:hypothetical protein [Thiocystis violacea]MBK1719835.1 hypothetical protein [Thiocystis violacea]
MAVEVYVWFPKLVSAELNIGHAAMKVDGGSPPSVVYISRWPGSYAGLIVSSAVNQRYADDIKAEGGPPAVVRLTKLDETAIKRAVMSNFTLSLYSFLSYNCATQVGKCLNEGIPGGAVVDIALGSVVGQYQALKHGAINTPWNLYLYAQSLRPVFG